MKWDFLNSVFQYEENKTPERNAAEYDAMIGHLTAKPSFTKTAYHIAGTRTSDVIFTPTVSEDWTIDVEIGKYMVSFVNSALSAFSIHQIADNTATTVTIGTTFGDATLKASADRIIIFDSWDDVQAMITYVAA